MPACRVRTGGDEGVEIVTTHVVRPDVEILYVRHGETIYNRERRMAGQKDAPLTLEGLRQAQRVGHLLKSRFGAGLAEWQWTSSPLGRAWQTAVILADVVGVPTTRIVHDDRLKEMTWGRWDGLTAAEIEAQDPELWRARLADRWTVAPPDGGETQRAIIERAGLWLAALPAAVRVVTTAHGGLGRALRVAYLGLPPATMLEMDEPHDAVFWFKQGRIDRLDAST